jgi:hypothetical protein
MRCGGSGLRQMLAWPPTPEDGYPGAVVCIKCSAGVQVRKGSVRRDTAMNGERGLSGIVKRHNKATR